jgi:hypothetical protein
MRVDIMCDIETLGTGVDATIFQIAAIAFDIKTGESLQTFNQVADISQSSDLKITGSTLIWWLNKDKELLTKLLNTGTKDHAGLTPVKLLRNFQKFLVSLGSTKTKGSEVFLWGNGILFDNRMLQYQLESNNMSYPIFYRNDRDMRTIVELAAHKLGMGIEEMKDRFKDPTLVKHDAFDDVKYQINIVSKCYNFLVGEGLI